MDVDQPLHDAGEWWLDIRVGDFETPVSWTPGLGFGIYFEPGGFGGRPDEIYQDPRLAAVRLQQMEAAWRVS